MNNLPCYYNSAVLCDNRVGCEYCGWHPYEKQRRILDIREKRQHKLKEEVKKNGKKKRRA